jgi:hypothetical protein
MHIFHLINSSSRLELFHVASGTYGLVVNWKEVFDQYLQADSSYYEVRLSPGKCCRVLMWNIRVYRISRGISNTGA